MSKAPTAPALELPKPFFQVLEEEESAISEARPPQEPPWLFPENWSGEEAGEFEASLNEATDARFAWIREREASGSRDLPIGKRLNDFIRTFSWQGNEILPEPLKEWHWKPYANPALNKRDQERLTRLLLEDLFPELIEKHEKEGLSRFYDHIHQRAAEGQPRTALCLSGGGIRSAIFALGALQSLGKRKILPHIDFLSTVSGGGYIGSVLSSLLARNNGDIDAVMKKLQSQRNAPVPVETHLIDHLRRYAKYLSPDASIVSLDLWTLIGTYLRNLLLNWSVLVPLAFLIVCVPRLLVSLYALPYSDIMEGVWRVSPPVFGFLSMCGFLCYLIINRPSLSERGPMAHPIWSDIQRPGLLKATCLMVAAAITLTLWWAWRAHWPIRQMPLTSYKLSFVSGAVLVMGSYLAIRVIRASRRRDPLKHIFKGKISILIALGLEGGAGGLIVRMSCGTGADVQQWLFWVYFFVLYLLAWLFAHTFLFATEGRMAITEGSKGSIFRQISGGLVASVIGGFLFALVGGELFQQPVKKDFVEQTWRFKVADNQPKKAEQSSLAEAATAPAPTPIKPEEKKVAAKDQRLLYTVVAAPAFMMIFFVSMTIFTAFAGKTITDSDLECFGKAGSAMLQWSVTWVAFTFWVIFGPPLLAQAPKEITAALGGLTGIVALLGGAGAATPATTSDRTSKRSDWLNAAVRLAAPILLLLITAGISGLLSLLLGKLAILTPNPIGAGIKLAPELPVLREPLFADHLLIFSNTPWWLIVPVMAGLAAVVLLMSSLVPSNKFSMHSVYRNRLIRTFLGATHECRNANPFTGFDEGDNIPLCDMQPGYLHAEQIRNPKKLARFLKSPAPLAKFIEQKIKSSNLPLHSRIWRPNPHEQALPPVVLQRLVETINRLLRNEDFSAIPGIELPNDTKSDEGEMSRAIRNRQILEKSANVEGVSICPMSKERALKPLHIINAALNLGSGDNLAWQDRKADSFTFSPLHCGNHRLGYRRSAVYGAGPISSITLGTAMTISGAAASPNMGYHSSRAVTLLLMLFNIRLGWWLGNSGRPGKESHVHSHPPRTISPLWEEALGKTASENKYVYLSDGGHFENLGLYEMVLRRSHLIIVADAGADPKTSFEDLGNAIRKIRIDLGISIRYQEFQMDLRRGGSNRERRYCAIGEIDYQSVDGDKAVNGTLIYFKPGLAGTEPRDVTSYKRSSDRFPHEPTLDQFFTESQFESYRVLGEHMVGSVWNGAEVSGNRSEVVKHLEKKAREHVGSKSVA